MVLQVTPSNVCRCLVGHGTAGVFGTTCHTLIKYDFGTTRCKTSGGWRWIRAIGKSGLLAKVGYRRQNSSPLAKVASSPLAKVAYWQK
jgi:hypothetical protein